MKNEKLQIKKYQAGGHPAADALETGYFLTLPVR